MVPRKVAADPFSVWQLQQFSRPTAYLYPCMCCRKIKRLVSERQMFLQVSCLPSTFLLLQSVNSVDKSSVKKLSVAAENMSECFPLYLAVMGAAAHLTGSNGAALSPSAPVAMSLLQSFLQGTLWHGLLPASLLCTFLWRQHSVSPRERPLHKVSASLLNLDCVVSFKIHRPWKVVGLI